MPHVDLATALESARSRWALSQLIQIADTATSWVYKAERGAGDPVALKILKPYGADEIVGVRLMTWYDRVGSAAILDVHQDMILIEWLDGVPLGDLARTGRDDEATQILCDVVLQLHQPRAGAVPELTTLRETFDPLFGADSTVWPSPNRADFAMAAQVAARLLDSSLERVPLHGDFHHDNVLGSGRGWLAIDAKGLIGDPAYEVCNVFRNPYGADSLALNMSRIGRLADAFSARLHFERKRVLSWAAAHSALSACWSHAAGNSIDFNLKILPKLLRAAEAG
jgi:streptomycin 6-kinase